MPGPTTQFYETVTKQKEERLNYFTKIRPKKRVLEQYCTHLADQ